MKVSYEQIEGIAQNLSTYADSMQKILEEITTEFQKVGEEGSVWSGNSAISIRATFDSLSAKFPDFYTTVKTCSTNLMTVVANYKSADAAITAQGEQ